jgi:hypothetical protein
MVVWLSLMGIATMNKLEKTGSKGRCADEYWQMKPARWNASMDE